MCIVKRSDAPIRLAFIRLCFSWSKLCGLRLSPPVVASYPTRNDARQCAASRDVIVGAGITGMSYSAGVPGTLLATTHITLNA